MSTEAQREPPAATPRWRPLTAIDRRVAGVLVEKAKTTPDIYPMSIHAICTAANQKNNRYPIMELEPDDVEESLARLRAAGAVSEVQASGRVAKYRHFLYEWLGVDKLELAVMAELLLRGAQTEGELRGRAARMEPIADLGALRPILDSLKAKKLVIPLTPEGRGHVVTHALYEPQELARLRAEYGSVPQGAAAGGAAISSAPPVRAPASISGPAAPSQPGFTADRASAADDAGLRRELADLRGQISELRQELASLTSEFQRRASDLDRLRDALGG